MTDRLPNPFNPPEWRGHAVLIAEWWKLTKGTRVAVCTLWNHPLGAEMRCDVDGEMFGTKAFGTIEELLDAADQWKSAFEAKGWTDERRH